MRYSFSLIFAFVLLVCTGLYSQTAWTFQNLDQQSAALRNPSALQSPSLANPWVGSKLAYNVDDSLSVGQSFLLSARIQVTAYSSNDFSVPVVSTVGLDNLSDPYNPDSGFNIGVYPYYLIINSSTWKLIAHAGGGYKLLNDGHQFKALVGLEAALSKPGGLPTTISVTPVYYFNSYLDDESAVEITGILPVTNKLGLLAEGTLPFGGDGQVRFGLIYATQ